MSIKTPDGQQVEVYDVSARLMIVPMGTTLHVPDGHEWYVMAVSVLPTRGYTPPLGTGEVRDARAWGDLQIRRNEAPNASFRANILTLIDRYWGRFNLNPLLPEITARLTAAQQAMYTAPKISELYTLLDHLMIQYQHYLDTAAPKLEQPLQLCAGEKFVVEHIASEGAAADEITTDTKIPFGAAHIKVLRALDVELSIFVRRPVS